MRRALARSLSHVTGGNELSDPRDTESLIMEGDFSILVLSDRVLVLRKNFIQDLAAKDAY